MQSLSTNIPLNTTSSLFNSSNKSAPPNYFEEFGFKDSDNMAFPLQHSIPMPGYFAPQRHNMQPNGFNPLCVQRAENYSFVYGTPSFDSSKSTASTFQSMNAGDYSGLNPNSPFRTGNTQHENYDI